MFKHKKTGRKIGTVMRTSLTVQRKLKIAEFKNFSKFHPEHYGLPGSSNWNNRLLEYLNDHILTLDDIERWVRAHRWISEFDPAPITTTGKSSRRPMTRSLSRERSTSPSQNVNTTSHNSRSPKRHQRTMRITRQMSSAIRDRRGRSLSRNSPSSDETVILNNKNRHRRHKSGITEPTDRQQYDTPKLVSTRSLRNIDAEPPVLQPMVSPQRIDFGRVVRAENYQTPSASEPQHYFVEQSHENPLDTSAHELSQNRQTPWPQFQQGLGLPGRQYMVIPTPPSQIQPGNPNNNGNGQPPQFIITNGSNWSQPQPPQSVEPQQYGSTGATGPENNPAPINIPVPPPFLMNSNNSQKVTTSFDLASDISLGMASLGDLSRACGRHEELRSCLLHVEKVFKVLQRTQKRSFLTLSHKDALAAAVVSKQPQVIKLEMGDNFDSAGSSGSVTPKATDFESQDDSDSDVVPAEVDISDDD